MNQSYHDATTKMEQANTDPSYVLGWQSGYMGMPQLEEQRINDAYSAGYEDGKAKNDSNFSSWVKA